MERLKTLIAKFRRNGNEAVASGINRDDCVGSCLLREARTYRTCADDLEAALAAVDTVPARERIAELIAQWRAEIAELRTRHNLSGVPSVFAQSRWMGMTKCADELTALLAAVDPVQGEEMRKCPTCGGSGSASERVEYGGPHYRVPCESCNGCGTVAAAPARAVQAEQQGEHHGMVEKVSVGKAEHQTNPVRSEEPQEVAVQAEPARQPADESVLRDLDTRIFYAEDALQSLIASAKLFRSKVSAEYPNKADRGASEASGYEHPSTEIASLLRHAIASSEMTTRRINDLASAVEQRETPPQADDEQMAVCRRLRETCGMIAQELFLLASNSPLIQATALRSAAHCVAAALTDGAMDWRKELEGLAAAGRETRPQDSIFWPHDDDSAEAYLYEIRHGSTPEYVQAHVEELKAMWGRETRAPQPPAWQPIETAPKEGKEADILLVYAPHYVQRIITAAWDRETAIEGGQCWRVSDAVNDRIEPTHWMSLKSIAPPSSVSAPAQENTK